MTQRYPDTNSIDIEQAHFTTALENGLIFYNWSLWFSLGFEREDPSGLYTHSRAYVHITWHHGSSLSILVMLTLSLRRIAVSYQRRGFLLNLIIPQSMEIQP